MPRQRPQTGSRREPNGTMTQWSYCSGTWWETVRTRSTSRIDKAAGSGSLSRFESISGEFMAHKADAKKTEEKHTHLKHASRKRACQVKGCKNEYRAKGYCNMH